ncbi:MAG: heavy-metal-associated domain-containing protein [Nitrospiraceae bacterium]|nr:MAG: heavy-metal-associated domain-containing protein [Nitrospiraceae bacterium]
MEKILFAMSRDVCDSCSLALKRFIGKMDGVESIDVEDGNVVINFNSEKISRDDLDRITRDSIDKLGYKLTS